MDRLAKERLKVFYLGVRPWSQHSMVLLVAGLAYFGIGYAYASDTTQTEERTKSLSFILEIIPFNHWGILFMIVGVLTILSARWPPRSEKWGYAVLTGFSAVWSSGFLFSMIFDGAPVSGVIGFLVWGLVAFLWWAISGLINPPVILAVVHDGRS